MARFLSFTDLRKKLVLTSARRNVRKASPRKRSFTGHQEGFPKRKPELCRYQPENQVCFIDGCNAKANTVEHIRGRGHGYFDAWAEERGIRKTLDQRFWRPCCLHHNLELERNPELSKKYQLSKLHNGKKY